MIQLTLAEIAAAVNGELINTHHPETVVNSVCTDTRNILQDCLFIAIKGNAFDAHSFLSQAKQAGASAVIIHQKSNTLLPSILVKDTRIALGLLSAYVKSKLTSLQCAAITGSNGKTTTKEMLSAILNEFCTAENAVLATAGNFNNDIGLPLTLLRLTEKTRFAVVELGANHQGEIAYTANLAKPDVALVNNVMPAHLEGFGSIEGIAKAKGEIWTSLSNKGTGVVNLDAKFSDDYIKQLNAQKTPVVTFSQYDKNASLFASDIEYDDLGRATFTLNYQAETQQVSLNLGGKHNISNALAAASMALVLGCNLPIIKQGLHLLNEVAGRVNSSRINEYLTLIDDTYNANSSSLKAAIDLLARCPGEQMLIFADMGELGKYSEQEHRDVGIYAAQNGINHLFTVGELTAFTSQAFKKISTKNALHFADKNALKAHLATYLQSNSSQKSTILVKGSRGTKMEEIVAYIKQPQIG